jgi:hypothetical protein
MMNPDAMVRPEAPDKGVWYGGRLVVYAVLDWHGRTSKELLHG